MASSFSMAEMENSELNSNVCHSEEISLFSFQFKFTL